MMKSGSWVTFDGLSSVLLKTKKRLVPMLEVTRETNEIRI